MVRAIRRTQVGRLTLIITLYYIPLWPKSRILGIVEPIGRSSPIGLGEAARDQKSRLEFPVVIGLNADLAAAKTRPRERMRLRFRGHWGIRAGISTRYGCNPQALVQD